MLFSLANLPYWIFLGAGIALFLIVIVSGGGDDDLDVDADVDADLDIDLGSDTNLDLDTDFESGGEGLSPLQVLTWFGVGRTPLILLLAMDLTLWGLVGWVLNVALAEVLGRTPMGLEAEGVFCGSLAFALWVGGMLSRPIGKIFFDLWRRR